MAWILTVLLVHQNFKWIHLIVLKSLPHLFDGVFVCQLPIHKTETNQRAQVSLTRRDYSTSTFWACVLYTALSQAPWNIHIYKVNLSVRFKKIYFTVLETLSSPLHLPSPRQTHPKEAKSNKRFMLENGRPENSTEFPNHSLAGQRKFLRRKDKQDLRMNSSWEGWQGTFQTKDMHVQRHRGGSQGNPRTRKQFCSVGQEHTQEGICSRQFREASRETRSQNRPGIINQVPFSNTQL